jgi:hypothetical protein
LLEGIGRSVNAANANIKVMRLLLGFTARVLAELWSLVTPTLPRSLAL